MTTRQRSPALVESFKSGEDPQIHDENNILGSASAIKALIAHEVKDSETVLLLAKYLAKERYHNIVASKITDFLIKVKPTDEATQKFLKQITNARFYGFMTAIFAKQILNSLQ
jgi:hypothetical protein